MNGFVNKFLSGEWSYQLSNEVMYNLNIFTKNGFELTILAIKKVVAQVITTTPIKNLQNF